MNTEESKSIKSEPIEKPSDNDSCVCGYCGSSEIVDYSYYENEKFVGLCLACNTALTSEEIVLSSDIDIKTSTPDSDVTRF